MHVSESELLIQRRRAEVVVETGRSWGRIHHDLVVGAAEVAEGSVWIADGARSAAHWIADRLDIEACTVRDWIRVGRALRGLHASADAWASGQISYAKVRALVSIATAENEPELLAIAREVPAADLTKALAAWSLRHQPHDVIERRHRAQRSYRSRVEADGTVVTTIRHSALSAGRLDAAVDAEVMRTCLATELDGSWPALRQQRHDAFHRLLEGCSSGRFELLIHCDESGSRLPDGTPLTSHSVIRLLDQAAIRVIVHDTNGSPVNASSARRRPTVRQQRLARSTHSACANCGGTDLPEVHHTVPHAESKRTDATELTTLCAPCHRQHHDRERADAQTPFPKEGR